MISTRILFLFAMAMIGLVVAQDYEEGGGGGGFGGFGGFEGGDDAGGGGDYEGAGDYADNSEDGESEDDGAAGAASNLRVIRIMRPFVEAPTHHQVSPSTTTPKSNKRQRRSLTPDASNIKNQAHSRVRRGHGYGVVGPVYTYVKTDYNGHFKWGVRHNVGKGYGHGGYGK